MPPDPSSPLPTPEQIEPLKLFGGIFIASSLAGLAALLRSRQPLHWRAVMSALLNSGFIGTIIALVWYAQYNNTNIYFLIGVSVLAGLGGAATIDFAFQYARSKFGIPSAPSSPTEPQPK